MGADLIVLGVSIDSPTMRAHRCAELLRGLILRHGKHSAGECAVGLSQLIQNREVIGVDDRYQVAWGMLIATASDHDRQLASSVGDTQRLLLYARLRASRDIVIQSIPALGHSFAPRTAGVAMLAAVAAMKARRLSYEPP